MQTQFGVDDMPLFSIIVPIYNVQKYINKCVESILNQTHKDLEIILVDDGSPDGCPQICDEYARQDSRVKVIHKDNGGLINARKSGLEAANGAYIGFVDGDDWIEPEMYALFADRIKKYSPDMVLSDFYYDYGNKLINSEQLFEQEFYNKQDLKSKMYPKMLFSGIYYKFGVNPCCWSKVYKKELIEKNLPQVDGRIKMGEDAAFTYPCLLDAQSVATIKTPCYHYITNPQSITQSYDKDMKDIIFLPYDRIKEKCRECGTDLGKQPDYYLIYLANFLLRNETSAKSYRVEVKGILNYDNLILAAKRASLSAVPAHIKFFIISLRLKNKMILSIYFRLLKCYLKRKQHRANRIS